MYTDPDQNQINPKILAIDDEEPMRELLTGILTEAGYVVITASNGSEGIELSIAEKPDLVILDIKMPEMNGFEVCERLRADEATKTIPILVLTGLAGTEDMERAINAGADDFIPKPVRVAEFLTRVATLLKMRKRDNQPLRQT